MTTIIKRDGSRAALDISRIRRVVEWACSGLNVSPLILESQMTERLRDGISSRSIQENLIQNSLELCSSECPDWRYVAGRLHIWSLWKDVQISRGFGYDFKSWFPWVYNLGISSFYGFDTHKNTPNKYDSRLGNYSVDDLKLAYSWINPDWDLDYDYAGATLLTSRYLQPDELPQEAFLLCALLLALPEKPENRLGIAKQIYNAIAQRKISLATPILGNLRIPNGSLSSCFIMSVEDNLEGIFKAITDTARISKNGGGVGVVVSAIRATGSWVMGKANASGGVIPWIKLLNDTAIAVNQGGRRAGAVTVGLDIWHLDIPEFLEMQAENGDQRRKAYDVFPQLIISDEFMRRVQSNSDWTLVDPYEVHEKLGYKLPELWGGLFEQAYAHIESEIGKKITLYKRINAKDLFKTIMRSQLETGLPYLAFKDTINRANPNQHDGYIPGVNLCNESFSNVKAGELVHCCNLVSLNLANVVTNHTSADELELMCRLAVRILDNTIELTTPPIKEAAAHNAKYRTIGVGVMGLADWLAKQQIQYSSIRRQKQDDWIEAYPIAALFDAFAFYCTDESANLAIERGAYPAFENSWWSRGFLVGNKEIKDDLSIPIPSRILNRFDYLNGWDYTDDEDYETQTDSLVTPDGIITSDPWINWRWLRDKIVRTGIRNSHITAIAPNTSSSLIQGCTASILPVFSRFFVNKAGKGAVPIAPPFIADKYWFYAENKTLHQQAVVDMTALIQRYIDTGISMELMFNLNKGIYYPNEPDRAITAKEIYEILFSAWEQGIKAIYYIRSVQKDSFTDACSSCAN